MRILVDADGCPRTVLTTTLRLGARFKVPVWTVANFNHDIQSDHHIAVEDDPQAVDLKIVSEAQPGDLVITGDGGLAAMLLGNRVRCIHPSGYEYSDSTIDSLLEERELKARFRRSGGRTRGPKKRVPQEDIRFEETLCSILQESSVS